VSSALGWRHDPCPLREQASIPRRSQEKTSISRAMRKSRKVEVRRRMQFRE